VLHGSPHRMNILARSGAPVFIDLETIQIGPIECGTSRTWSLKSPAHIRRTTTMIGFGFVGLR
jgi:hypothetical protein